jgi:hypothetical protein
MHLATFQRIAAGVLIGSLVSACSAGGDGTPAESEPIEAPVAATPAKQKTFLDAQLKAIDKAKTVEQTLQQDAANTDKAIEDSGG